MNKVILTGRLTKDAETKQYNTKNGKQNVLTGTIAVDRPYTGSQDKKTADFFQFEQWIKEESTLPQYLLKGTLIEVEGQMRQDSKRHDDGSFENYSVKVVSAKIGLLSKAGGTMNESQHQVVPETKQEVKKTTPPSENNNDGVPWELDL